MRRAARVDVNQRQITKELREQGYSVAITSQLGKGFPDIVVGFKGVNLMVELKATSKDKLTPHEVEFRDNWKGQYLIAWSTEMIIEAFDPLIGAVTS